MADERRTYTVDEARALVPQIRAVLLALAVERRQFSQSGPAEVSAGVASLVGHLESLGVELRDLDEGLVDIPTERDGAPAWFCWRLADPELGFWHSTREGFASRHPL